VKCSRGLRLMLEAGVDGSHVTFTSDGQGSLPAFDAQGRLQRLEVGSVTTLFGEVRDAVLHEQIPLETALQVVTANPARILKLGGKGQLVAGADADLVLLDPKSLEIRGVIARGRWLMRDGGPLVKGTFE
jgi:beta-aspartyl-dipeptidase (metallo-type)